MKLAKVTASIFGVSILAILAGCVGYKPPPDVIHSDTYTGNPVQENTNLPADSKILTVDEAVQIAVANNPTYEQARLSMISAYASYYKDLAGYSPTLTATYGATETQRASGTPGPKSTEYTGNLEANWELFNGFQTTMAVLDGLASAKGAEYAYQNALRQLVFSVKNQYYSVLNDRANIKIQQANVEYNDVQVKTAQLKYDAGAGSLTDLLNFEIGKNDAEATLIGYIAQYYVDRFALAQFMGFTTSDLPMNIEFPEIDVPEDNQYSLGVDFYLDMAIKQRPDLQAQRETVNAAKYSLYGAWGAFSPTASVDMNYGYSKTSDVSTSWFGGSMRPEGGQNLNYNYGFNVSWDIWEGGARIANVRGAQAAYDSAQEGLLTTWIQVVNDVRTAYTKLLSNMSVRKIQEQSVAMSTKRRDLLQEEYNAGNVDISTLNQAQSQLITSQSSYIQAVINVAVQRAQLDEAAGMKQIP